jgi:hypothetical protein
MPMTEDLSVFFSAAEFAHAALLDGESVTGVFDNGYSAQFGDIATTLPSFTLPSAAAASATQGSELRIAMADCAAGVPLSVNGAATVYQVRSVEPDGTGVTRLVLELTE